MTKYELRITGECKQNLKICKKRGLPMQELIPIFSERTNDNQLPNDFNRDFRYEKD